MSGCAEPSSDGADVPELWRAQIEQALAGDDVTETQREVLVDYAVTEAEYGELRQELSDCLTGHGIEHDLNPQGGSLEVVDLPGDDGTQTQDLATECMDGTVGPVEGIYVGMHDNPEGLGKGEAVRECLDESEATEYAGVAAAELDRQIAAGEFAPTTAEAMRCTVDPFGVHGVTLDAARGMLAGDASGGSGEQQ